MATDDVFDIHLTRLHTEIQLEATPPDSDELVIFDPRRPAAWVQSTRYVDTYDFR